MLTRKVSKSQIVGERKHGSARCVIWRWSDTTHCSFCLQKAVQSGPNQFIFTVSTSLCSGAKNDKSKIENKVKKQISNNGLQAKFVTPQSLKFAKISYCQLQSLTDTGLGKLGIMGKKQSESLA